MTQAALDELVEQARSILKTNDKGNYTQPANGLYPHQWLWDSCFTAIGLRHIDVERAKMELQYLLRGQWHNGMLPNIVFRDDPKFIGDRNVWRSWVNPFAPNDVVTTGITQPPMLAEAVVQVGEKLDWPERRRWYKFMYAPLLAHHEWLYDERDPHREGLVLQIHPWEVGLDNTPPWMAELNEHLMPLWIRLIEKLGLSKVISLIRTDSRKVNISQRTSIGESLAMYDTQLRLRRKAYDINKILDHALFTIEDLNFNCILIRANSHLKDIARAIRTEIPSELNESMKKTAKKLEELWDPYASQYYSRDFVTHRLLKTPSIATLMPLYAGCISQERAEVLVSQLENEHLFGTAYPVPSVPPSSFWFNPIRYWQGPSWVNTNWLIIDGLKRYGYKEHAQALKETTIEMVQKAGFYEYFNPLNGEGAGAKDFSWTAALIIDLIKS
jgi:hypothetical protein